MEQFLQQETSSSALQKEHVNIQTSQTILFLHSNTKIRFYLDIRRNAKTSYE